MGKWQIIGNRQSPTARRYRPRIQKNAEYFHRLCGSGKGRCRREGTNTASRFRLERRGKLGGGASDVASGRKWKCWEWRMDQPQRQELSDPRAGALGGLARS